MWQVCLTILVFDLLDVGQCVICHDFSSLHDTTPALALTETSLVHPDYIIALFRNLLGQPSISSLVLSMTMLEINDSFRSSLARGVSVVSKFNSALSTVICYM